MRQTPVRTCKHIWCVIDFLDSPKVELMGFEVNPGKYRLFISHFATKGRCRWSKATLLIALLSRTTEMIDPGGPYEAQRSSLCDSRRTTATAFWTAIFIFYLFALFINEAKVYIILQERSRGKQRASTWGSWSETFMSRSHDLIRLNTRGP